MVKAYGALPQVQHNSIAHVGSVPYRLQNFQAAAAPQKSALLLYTPARSSSSYAVFLRASLSAHSCFLTAPFFQPCTDTRACALSLRLP
jgi:hypothetical protein